jgi:hypothetical protein
LVVGAELVGSVSGVVDPPVSVVVNSEIVDVGVVGPISADGSASTDGPTSVDSASTFTSDSDFGSKETGILSRHLLERLEDCDCGVDCNEGDSGDDGGPDAFGAVDGVGCDCGVDGGVCGAGGDDVDGGGVVKLDGIGCDCGGGGGDGDIFINPSCSRS